MDWGSVGNEQNEDENDNESNIIKRLEKEDNEELNDKTNDRNISIETVENEDDDEEDDEDSPSPRRRVQFHKSTKPAVQSEEPQSILRTRSGHVVQTPAQFKDDTDYGL